jgi:hypothetical protein
MPVASPGFFRRPLFHPAYGSASAVGRISTTAPLPPQLLTHLFDASHAS